MTHWVSSASFLHVEIFINLSIRHAEYQHQGSKTLVNFFFQFDKSRFFLLPSDLILFSNCRSFRSFLTDFFVCWIVDHLELLNCWRRLASESSIWKSLFFVLLSDRILFFEIAAFWHIFVSYERFLSLIIYVCKSHWFVCIDFAYKVENVMALHWPNSMCIVKMILPRISFSPS